jgi:hypothetical protein
MVSARDRADLATAWDDGDKSMMAAIALAGLLLAGCASTPAAILLPIPCPDAPPRPAVTFRLNPETDEMWLHPWRAMVDYIVGLQVAHAKCRAAAEPSP